jgi:hypothetical protein
VLGKPAPAPILAQPITLFMSPPGSPPPPQAQPGEDVRAALREVSISTETLKQIWELIEQDKANQTAKD